MADKYHSFSRVGVLRLLVVGFALSGLAAASPCAAAGTRPGGGPSTSKDKTTWNPTYVPSGQAGFGVSGPTDQDDGGKGDPDKTDDACITLTFNVPAASPDKKGVGGWGGLTLSFNEPIDGGSFIFDPVCPTPQNGTLGQIAPGGAEPTTLPNQSITFMPLVKSKPYYVLPTGRPAVKNSVNPIDYTGTQAPNYSQFVVTIMYDASQGVPKLQATDAVGGPGSFWVGKPGKQSGGFSPYPGLAGPGTIGVDYLPASPVPEPSFLASLFGCLGLLIFAHRRRSRSAPRI
jgi:hypothetical protein